MKFKFIVENYEWDASISVDSEDKPTLLLFEDNQPIENLVEASSLEILHYRNELKNNFKVRIKKTSFKFYMMATKLQSVASMIAVIVSLL